MEIITWAAEEVSCPIKIELLLKWYHNLIFIEISIIITDQEMLVVILTQPGLESCSKTQLQEGSVPQKKELEGLTIELRGTEQKNIKKQSKTSSPCSIVCMRKNRKLIEGAEYHVTARINRGEMIFSNREDRELFIDVLKRVKKKYSFSIKNFCIMGNHVHFLLKPGVGVSLSKIMQWLLGVFAQLWNKRHGLSGHLWGDRFFSRIILGILDFLRVFLYIDQNPVIAGLAEYPEQWEYGGAWHQKNKINDIIELDSGAPE